MPRILRNALLREVWANKGKQTARGADHACSLATVERPVLRCRRGRQPANTRVSSRSWTFPPASRTSRSKTWCVSSSIARHAPCAHHARAARRHVCTCRVRTCHPAASASPWWPVCQVGSCDVKFPIRLEGLAYKHSHYSSYEPELFPGLIYRMVQPKIVLLIFVSGKVVLTGGKVRNEIYSAFEQIYPVLQEFRKVHTPAAEPAEA